VPEWLKSDGFIEQEETVEPAVQENQAVDKSLPDWLKELEVDEPTAEAMETPSSEEIPVEPLPDWLQGLNIEDETRSTNKNLEPVEKKGDTLPDWMQSVENKPVEEPQTPIEEPMFVEPEPLPDWLRGLDEAATPTLETPTEIGKTEDVPTWVNELDNLSSDETRPGATKPLVFPLDIREPIEPEGSFEVTPEEETSIPEIVQTETLAAAAPAADLSEVSEPSIPDGDRDVMLSQAQTAMDKGRLSEALDAYNQLISSGNLLEEAIHDLRDALYRYPVDIGLWQALGDAYVRDNRLQDALDAYTKAEELLR
jgi:hypothetical protein